MEQAEHLDPIPPGEILREEFLVPFAMSQAQLAKAIDVPPGRITDILKGKRAVTADTALRLGRYFNMSPEFWLGLQMDYDLRLAQRQLGDRLQSQIRPMEQYGT